MAQSMREQLRDQSGAYLPRLVAVLYAVFDPVAGPTIVHQVPEGSVATRLSTFPSRGDLAHSPEKSAPVPLGPSRTNDAVARSAEQGLNSTQVLFDFSSILEFVIPKPELCGHLITKATRTSKIVGFPVRIVDEEKYSKGKEVYNRNAFIFNVCFVFDRDAELSAFEPVVRKTGRTLRMLEESSSLLSSPPPTFSMGNLLEQLYMDINNFSESSIRIADTDLDLFLTPFYVNPPKIHNWDVPIAIAPLETKKHPSWDVTLFKICSFINGVNHVKRIAELAEVDLHLARLSIQHLVFYSAVIIVDLFQYSNSYTALPSIADAAQYGEEDEEGMTDLRSECEAYVYSGTGDTPPVPFATLLSLYSSLKPALSLSAWIELHSLDARPIDIRRMVQFGVIKGFLRRVYAYPIWLDHPSLASAQPRGPPSDTRRHSEVPSFADTALSASTQPSPHPRRPADFSPNRPAYNRNTSSSIFSSVASSTSQNDATPMRARSPGRAGGYVDAPARPQVRTALMTGAVNSPRLPQAASASAVTAPGALSYPASLPLMMDGTHHTDEICIKYGVSLRQLEVVLKHLGGAASGELPTPVSDDGGQRRGSIASFGSRLVMLNI